MLYSYTKLLFSCVEMFQNKFVISGFTFTLLWLLPVTVSSGVLRELEDYTDDPCRVYNMDNLIHLDCSYRGLSELPDGLDYNVSSIVLIATL